MTEPPRLDAHQSVPLTRGEREMIRELASAQGMTPGLYSRALMRLVLDNHAELEDVVTAAVAAERADAAARTRATTRTANRARWRR